MLLLKAPLTTKSLLRETPLHVVLKLLLKLKIEKKQTHLAKVDGMEIKDTIK